MNKVEKLKKISRNATVLIKPDLSNDSNTRWKNKEVKESFELFDGKNLDQIVVKDDLKWAIEEYETGKECFAMEGITYAEGGPRPTKSLTIKLNNLDLTKYNRLSFYIKPISVGYQNFYFHISMYNNGSVITDAPSLDPNVWNHIPWEIGGFDRNNVDTITITAFMMGCPPEGLPEVKFYIRNIYAEVVEEDYDNGWDPQDRIAYSHVGYYPNQEKIAVTGVCNEKEFFLKNQDGEVVFKGKTNLIVNNLGKFCEMNFSDFKEIGEYYIQVGDRKTELFEVSNSPYDMSIWKSMNFLRLLRCGEDIPGVHSPCHLNCRSVDSEGNSVPVFGGWHDAGDVSQFEICTAEMAHAILDLAEVVKDEDLYNRLLDEARVGLNWLLRTRFGNGMRALAVLYNVWRDNVLKVDNKSTALNVAENGPFENFVASAALAKAYKFYNEEDPVFSEWCLRAGIEDFEFGVDGYKNGIYTKRWGPNIDSQVAGHGIIAACEIYAVTKDEKYLDIAKDYAKIVLSCQEVEGIGESKLKGFFYEDPKHEWILTYEHRGHEQSPIHGLARLMEVCPNDTEFSSWKKGLELYREYILNTLSLSKPYGVLPGHIYILDKINMERFTVPPSYGTKPEALIKLRKQASTGLKIADNAYMRIFPISIQRKGYHATLLSKTKAVSMIAKVLKDDQLKQICIDQLEWMFGKNPFSSSTMYGEGHNYHPLYVAFSPQMVGALPVGIKTKGDEDAPYWPMMTQAVYKEIWGHTTGKYLWVLADLYGDYYE